MNADDQKLTQPENRDNDEEETLVTSETNALATPNEESATGETDADESAEPVQPTFETLDDESETGETDADQSAEPIPPVIETLDKTALNSAAPPRIVSETPLGVCPSRARSCIRSRHPLPRSRNTKSMTSPKKSCSAPALKKRQARQTSRPRSRRRLKPLNRCPPRP